MTQTTARILEPDDSESQPVRILRAADAVLSPAQYHDLKFICQICLFFARQSRPTPSRIIIRVQYLATWGTPHGVAAGVALRGVLSHSSHIPS